VSQEAELSARVDSEKNLGGSSETMYFIGLDVHKRTISYCVKDATGRVHQEGRIGSTRRELDWWQRCGGNAVVFAQLPNLETSWSFDRVSRRTQ
jgi:transposase